MDLERSGSGLIEAVFQHLPGQIEENHAKTHSG
jgi:hypothetical protein